MTYKEVESNVFKFEKVGDFIEGELTAIEDGKVHNNKVYKIKQGDGTTATVFSTTVMESKMSTAKIGDKVKIVSDGVEESKTAGHNPIKLFKVFIDE